MFYGDNVQDTRQLFFDSWTKHKAKQPLLPLEAQIADVILMHPEYHTLLEQPEKLKDKTYFPEIGETNPFLHMGLHLAVREQLATNRPEGIRDLYQQFQNQQMAPHEIEHLMMEQLAECLWIAQRDHQLPDEKAYYERLKTLSSC